MLGQKDMPVESALRLPDLTVNDVYSTDTDSPSFIALSENAFVRSCNKLELLRRLTH